MMTLARVISEHWHAVERDLISLGYHADDIGTKLSVWELVSIVIAAPPGSAVFHAGGGWSKEAEMLANLSEQQAGVIQLDSRYTRPGVDDAARVPTSDIQRLANYSGIALEPMTVEELTRTLKERQEAARAAGIADLTSLADDGLGPGSSLGGDKHQGMSQSYFGIAGEMS
jgi:hypothetical protein